MRKALVALILVIASGSAIAQEPPIRGGLVEGVKCGSDPTQTYTLFLPSTYDPETLWPVLLVLDPRGRSVTAAELFRESAEEYGWIILSSNDTRSDTVDNPNIRAINAMWPELQMRYAADPRRIYAAAFSGTMVSAFLMGRGYDDFGGVIGAGGRFFPQILRGAEFPFFGAVGSVDFNYEQMRSVDSMLDELGTPHRLVVFDGPHSWMPQPVAGEALEWMELEAMRAGLRPRDGALVDRLYTRDVSAAERLASTGSPLEALRRYTAIVRTFDELRDVAEARRRVDALTGSPEVKKALKDERRWDRFELRYRQDFASAVALFEGEEVPPSDERLTVQIGLADLLERKDRDGIEGTTARRLLNHVFTMTSFYLTRDLLADHRYTHAAASLGVATRIRDNPVVWYNLACAEAMSGRENAALDALEKAVETGFDDVQLMTSDEDLESIRGTERYQKLVRGLEVLRS